MSDLFLVPPRPSAIATLAVMPILLVGPPPWVRRALSAALAHHSSKAQAGGVCPGIFDG